VQLSHALRVGAGDVISFTGGGGKTTAMFRLAFELAANGLRVVTTTSTRIFAAQTVLAPFHIETDGTALPDPAQLQALLAEWGQVLVTGPVTAGTGKAAGVSLSVIEAIRQLPGVDVVLVEADGSRMRPFKAPAVHEPVVPAGTTILVPVVGLDVLGCRLDEEHVHRAERVPTLTGQPPGAVIDADMVANLIAHPEGGAKGRPPGARLVPLLNKVDLLATDDPEQLPAVVQAVVDRLLTHDAVDEVLVGAVRTAHPVTQVVGRVAGVILAAGAGQRFGGLKQLAPWQGRPLVQHVAATALASSVLDRVVLVLGCGADTIVPAVRPLGDRLQIVHNDAWAAGQSTSLHAGLRAIQHDGRAVSAVLFLLGDQPDVTRAVLDELVAAYRRTRADLVVPYYQGQRGNPVLFDCRTFAALLALHGDAGGRVLLNDPTWSQVVVAFDQPPLADIDTPADLNSL
jgi:molybdenum cofactor cytidylyltransferase